MAKLSALTLEMGLVLFFVLNFEEHSSLKVS